MKYASYRQIGGTLDDRQIHCASRMPSAAVAGTAHRTFCHAMSDMALAFFAYQAPARYDAKRDRVVCGGHSFTASNPSKYARMAA